MQVVKPNRSSIRLHLTNIIGLGAVRLLQSLLPSLVGQRGYMIKEAYLPSIGDLANFRMFDEGTTVSTYKRYLPKAISRLLECTVMGSQFDGASPLLVFGDIPIKCTAKQTVFVQSPLMVSGASTGRQLGALKYWIARWLFRRNMKYVSNFIVQTEAMRTALVDSYPEIKSRIHVIAQPAPSWLIDAQIKRTEFTPANANGLRLFYPAAFYPHKNHKILGKINTATAYWPISKLILTIPENINPNPNVPWVRCIDKLKPEAVVDVYQNVDALIFLSLSESYGFPLVEAMWIGLPIICPDLPYARTLCGDQALYFDPYDVDSLNAAVIQLSKVLHEGWWPDWSLCLNKIPRDWDDVASAMLKIASE